eukprot:1488958-Rhodomonas_salina.1
MDVVAIAQNVTDGPWGPQVANLKRLIASYNHTGTPLSIEEVTFALVIQQFLQSEQYKSLGTAMLNEEEMDFKSLDLKATALDQTVTSAKKASGLLGTTLQANSTKVEKPESDESDSLAEIMSAIMITVLSAKVNGKKSTANKSCTVCLLPGHDLSECHRAKQGLTTPVKCRICSETGHSWCKHGRENKAKEAYQRVHALTHAPTDRSKLDSAATEHVTNNVRYTRDNLPCNMQIKVANSQSILQPMKGKVQLV